MNYMVQFSIAAVMIAALSNGPAHGAGVPKDRLERLSSGVNVTQWFEVYSPQRESHYRDYMSEDEMALIRHLGLRHVRLCSSPQYLYDPADPQHLNPAHLDDLETAIRRFHGHDLAVVLDPHNGDEKR